MACQMNSEELFSGFIAKSLLDLSRFIKYSVSRMNETRFEELLVR